jgi:glycerate 2-kinase
MPPSKQILREIFHQTLSSIDIPSVMERKLECNGSQLVLPSSCIELAGISRVVVIAVGKAAHAMATGFLPFVPAHTSLQGVVVAPTPPPAPHYPSFEYFVGGHPIPTPASMHAAAAILDLLRTCDSRTLAVFLLSGGASALVDLPLDPAMNLEDVQSVHRALVTCGAPIDAMNTVRRHLSAVKGGRLALAAGAAKKITLAVTDVPVGKEAALASGPSLPDPTTIADVHRIFADYQLLQNFPTALRQWIESSLMPETPKADHPAFTNSCFEVLLNMHDLFHAAHHAVEAHGYATVCDNSTDDWPVEKAADNLLSQLESWQRANRGERVAIIADGEVSSPVTGTGIGGRNSAFVLSCVEKIAGRKIAVLSVGTDGIDGNSPAAGAVADGETLARAKSSGLDPPRAFANSDAYTFFSALEDAIVTGPTGNNLRDLRVLLAEP